MGTVPTPPTFVAGTSVGVTAQLNQLRDVQRFMLDLPKVYGYQGTTPTTMTTSGTVYVAGLDAELFDNPYPAALGGDTPCHDLVTNNSRLVCRTAGKYRVFAQAAFVNNATGIRAIQVRQNAAGNPASGTMLYSAQGATLTGGFTTVLVGEPFECALTVNDYIELFVQQTSGGSLNTVVGAFNTFLLMEWAGL